MTVTRAVLPLTRLGCAVLLATAMVLARDGTPSHSLSSHVEGVAIADRAKCGTARDQPPDYQHVVWIIFENKQYSHVIDAPDAPSFTAVAHACGLATNFFAETHPSAPNYVAMTSGALHGLHDDADPIGHPISAPNVFSQLGTGRWRAYIESMPTNCRRRFLLPQYYARHNAPAYYTNIGSDCAQFDVPLPSEIDLSMPLTYVVPNSCHSMHTCDVGSGDKWLRSFLPKVFSSPQYRQSNTVVFITWDEADNGNNHIPTLVIAPSVKPGTTIGTRYTHYSLLRTTQELLHLSPLLGHAAQAPSMATAFGLR